MTFVTGFASLFLFLGFHYIDPSTYRSGGLNLEFGHLVPVAASGIALIGALALTAPFLLTRRASGL